MRKLFVVLLVTVSLVAAQDKKPEEKKPEPLTYSSSNVITMPAGWSTTCKIVIIGKEEKRAVIDFCGDKVTYGGDLALDESAKVFFTAVWMACRQQDPKK